MAPIWNVNDLFKFGFKTPFDPEDGSLLSLLDSDAKKVLMNGASSHEVFAARVRELVRRLLDMDQPRITQQMLDFLMMDGTPLFQLLTR